MSSFLNDVIDGPNFAHRFVFQCKMVKCLIQSSYVTITSHDVIYIKHWPKNAQTLECDFEKPQN